ARAFLPPPPLLWAFTPLFCALVASSGAGLRFAGATHFPPPLALDAIADRPQAQAYASQMGGAIAQVAIAIGLIWLLSPVVDVNNNPDNPVIYVRAFGQTAARVSDLTQAFIAGAQALPVLTTAKHFPGHGDTAVDSHLQLPVIPHDRDRLDQVELVPFEGAIAAGVDAVMTAHLQVPALDPDSPSTLSKPTLTGLLRQSMGFDGLVVTDALIMGAISRHYGPYEAAVLALEAGADILLMPADPAGTIAAICEAVKVGRLSPERILDSVHRIWRAKQKVMTPLTAAPPNPHAWEAVVPPPVQVEQLAQSQTRQLIADITTASMQIRGQIPPLAAGQSGQTLLLVDDVLTTPWLSTTAPAIALPKQQGYSHRLIDTAGCSISPGRLPTQPTLLQIFSRGNPFRGVAGLGEFALAWFRSLRDDDCLLGVVVYGSPYTLNSLLPELPREVPYGFSYGQMPASQAVVLSALLATAPAEAPTAVFTD
ncbi:MAG: glycoside hydrolase family 3 N-terminal domain-containing protein, partial [Leptolyngbyaceae cyanobacterium]